MKKTIFLVLVTVMALAGCSKDEEGTHQDPIIGKWQYSAEVLFKNGEKQPTEELSDCQKKSWIKFEADGNGTANYFSSYNTGNKVECVGDDFGVFKWVNKGNNIYRYLDNNEGMDFKITFENKKMKISRTEIEGDVEYTEIDVYTLVE